MKDTEKSENTTETINDSGIVDAKNFKTASRAAIDPLEKEERQAAKKSAKEAPKGAFVVTTRLKADGKRFERGDEYVGKLYNDLLASKSVVPKEEWAKR